MLNLITWRSLTGKTTLQQFAIENWMTTLYNYVTRPPRETRDKDFYVFLTPFQFGFKLWSGEFAEWVEYPENSWNHYAMSERCLNGELLKDTKQDVVRIVTPHWREQLINYCTIHWVPHCSFFIDCSDEEIERRAITRGEDKSFLEKRKGDKELFKPTESCKVLNGEKETSLLFKEILWNIK